MWISGEYFRKGAIMEYWQILLTGYFFISTLLAAARIKRFTDFEDYALTLTLEEIETLEEPPVLLDVLTTLFVPSTIIICIWMAVSKYHGLHLF